MYHDIVKIFKDEFLTEHSNEEQLQRQPYNLQNEINRLKTLIANDCELQNIEYMENICQINYRGAWVVSIFGDVAHLGLNKLIEFDAIEREENAFYGIEDDMIDDEILIYMFIGIFQLVSKGGAFLLHSVFRDCLQQTLAKAKCACLAENDNNTDICSFGADTNITEEF